jgi:sterol desaturase/sphingolipid hydroxylase (fatty acid hydroxylase superfamily)
MDDALYGTRDKRGDWKPSKLLSHPPVFIWPAQPIAFFKWLFGYPGYILPWNLLYGLIGVLLWLYATPSMATMKTISPGWVAFLLARNAVLVFAFFGAFHLRLYMQKAQGTKFKFNRQWPSVDNSSFLFKNQNIDNLIWTFASGVPIWTAFEVVTLWAFANHYIPYVSFAAHPFYCAAIFFLIPLWRQIHFYLVHRLIHAHALYHSIHKLHHNNVNPGPWSGLAMHPVEHLLYFSVVLIHWIVPSNPVHAIFDLAHAALAPAPGHAGFERVVLSDGAAVDVPCYEHYLHHKFFECNYADGAIPIDKWFGTFHDGSKEAEIRMNKRYMDRAKTQRERRDAKAARRVS